MIGRGVVRSVAALAVLAASGTGAPPQFTPVQPDVLSANHTLVNAWADFDDDARLDLFVGLNGTPNRLYRNDRGTFVDVAASVGLADARPTRAAAWGDFDADGDADLLVGFAPGAQSVLRLYRNDRGRFVDVTDVAGVARDSGAVRQLSWVDVDGDRDLDLFVAFRDRPNALFRNDAGHLTDVAAEVGLADPRRSVGAVWFDYDEDGDLDLYLANMDGDANALYRNRGGRFVDVAESLGIAWGGRTPRDSTNGTVRPCAADVNNDGHLDLVTANYGRNGLFLNRGGGKFEDASTAWGVDIDSRYDTCALADFDNDGLIDLYVNGTVTGGVSYRDYLFRNTGSRFEEVTPENVKALAADHGVQWADVDEDGDVDLALTGSGADTVPLLLRNDLDGQDRLRSLTVVPAHRGSSSPIAGAEVRVYAAGTRRVLGTRLVDTGSGYNAQSITPVHFGLPARQQVDVEVVVPRRGARRSFWVRGAAPPPSSTVPGAPFRVIVEIP